MAAQSGVATATISITPVGDTPQAASIVTFEDTQSGAIVLDRNASDGAEVTHFRISNILGGMLYHTDSVTVINAGVYITVAEGNTGLKFTPASDSTVPGSFDVESSEDGLSVAAQSSVATAAISITPVGDTPQAASISTLQDTQSGPIVLDRNSNDGPEVTHFRISTIVGGMLYQNDGLTAINDGDFISVAEGQAGLKFTPAMGSTMPGGFEVESSEDGMTVAAQSGVATSTITIITASGLWLSTEDDVPSPSQVPGLDSWGQDELLAFNEPNFDLEPGMTNGTLYPIFNLDSFALDGDADVKGIHYVSQDITIGGNFFPAMDLFTGDLLLVVDSSETLDGTGANLLSVTSHDVFVFRPDAAGDYSAGTFLLLLQDPSGDPLTSISLVENLTLVGDDDAEQRNLYLQSDE